MNVFVMFNGSHTIFESTCAILIAMDSEKIYSKLWRGNKRWKKISTASIFEFSLHMWKKETVLSSSVPNYYGFVIIFGIGDVMIKTSQDPVSLKSMNVARHVRSSMHRARRLCGIYTNSNGILLVEKVETTLNRLKWSLNALNFPFCTKLRRLQLTTNKEDGVHKRIRYSLNEKKRSHDNTNLVIH